MSFEKGGTVVTYALEQRTHSTTSDGIKSAVPNDTVEAPAPSMFLPIRRMEVGAANDPAEADADRLADRALHQLVGGRVSGRENELPAPDIVPIRRSRISRPAPISADGGAVDSETQARITASRSRGTALPGTLRRRLEGAFESDFADVRLHHDAEAGELGARLSARAFTTGSDIYFGTGEFAPGTPSGLRTLAHELGHVVQGRSGSAAHRLPIRRTPITGPTWQAVKNGLVGLNPAMNPPGNVTEETGAAIVAKPALHPLLTGPAELGKFASYVGPKSDAPTALVRAQLLIDFNTCFGKSGPLPFPLPKSVPADTFWPTLASAIVDITQIGLSATDRAEVLNIIASSCGYFKTLFDAAGHAKPQAFFPMLLGIKRTGGQIGFAGDKGQRLAELLAIWQTCPVGTWNGFPVWGNAAAATPDENVSDHCLKHVFYSFDPTLAVEQQTPVTEPQVWWNRLKLAFSLDQILTRPLTDELFKTGGDWDKMLTTVFGADYRDKAQTITIDPAKPEHLAVVGRACWEIAEARVYLLSQAAKLYGQAGLDIAKNLVDVQVFSDKTGAVFQVSGRDGNFFCAGRATNGVLTMSSVYVATNVAAKVDSSAANKVWKVN